MKLERSVTATGATGAVVKVVRDKTFLLREGMWIDTTFDVDRMTPTKVGFASDDYFALIEARPEWGAYFAVGDRVLVVLEGQAYQVVGTDQGERIEIPTPIPTRSVQEVTRATPLVQKTPLPEVTDTVQQPTSTPFSPDRSISCGGATVATLLPLLAAAWYTRRG
jgi:Ca-activated chloride channel family protein